MRIIQKDINKTVIYSTGSLLNYQEQCGRVLCGLNNSGEAWYHQGSSPPEMRVHSFPAGIKQGIINHRNTRQKKTT